MRDTNPTGSLPNCRRASAVDLGSRASSPNCRSGRQSQKNVAGILVALCLLFTNGAATQATPIQFEKQFTLFDTFGQTPHSATNVFIRVETFGTLTRYWQPIAPNTMGEVVYKMDVPGVIVSANFDARMGIYNGHSLPAFDPGASAWLDVSTDGISWDNLFEALPTTASHIAADHYDITPHVQGASVVYFRARLFMTTNPSGYGCTQFMRINGDGGGYDPFTLRADVAAVPEINPAGFGSVVALVAGAIGLLERRRLKASACPVNFS
jgi:hypothetical protein